LSLRKEAIWSLSNIAANSHDSIQSIIDFGLLPCIVRKITEDDSFVRKEASFTSANIIWKGTPEQTKIMVEAKCLPPMIEFVKSIPVDSDPKTIYYQMSQLVIETFYNLFRPHIPMEDKVVYAKLVKQFGDDFLQQVIAITAVPDHRTQANSILSKIHEINSQN
jgi:hypothetical protein